MAALLACLCLLPDMAAHAQSPPRKVVVNGRVADESGDPVAGATIVERGTSNGVATLSEGEFSIAVLPGAVLDVFCLLFRKAGCLRSRRTKHSSSRCCPLS